ncbi:MAG: hypothetical protein HQK53_17410 [Oligoflexia bacterium]|nr:hypothetical protein [Oligoflexia bacterium]
MKKLILIIALLLSNLSVFANIESLPGNLLLEVETSGGFVPSEFVGHSEGVRIFTDGTVFNFKKKSFRDLEKTSLLATLSQNVIKNLRSTVEEVENGELIDENPTGPMCMDIPTTTFSLKKENGVRITFASNSNCKRYFIQDSRSRILKEILTGFKFLQSN